MTDHYRKYSFISSISEDGFWWSENGLIKRTPGKLTYVPGEPAWLKLLGVFESGTADKTDDLGSIFGELSDGRLVTLAESIGMGYKINFDRFGESELKFMSNVAFVGDFHVASDEVFHSARLGLSCLESWIGRRPYDNNNQSKDKDGVLKTSITHSCLPAQKYYVPEIEASIIFANGFNYSSPNESTKSLTNEESISIVPRKKQSAQWYLGRAMDLNILISSLAATPGAVEYVSLRRKKSTSKRSSLYDQYVTVFGSNRMPVKKSLMRSHEVIISYIEIQHRAKHILGKWFNRPLSERTATTMLHSIRSRKPTLDVELLIRVQAFESWMQGRRKNSYIPKKEYRKIRERMIDAAGPQLHENEDLLLSVTNALNFGNEKSLAQKMASELENADPEIVDRLLLMKKEEFSSAVASTRNYFTHRLTKASKNVQRSGRDLDQLNDSLEWFMWYLVLSDIGIPKKVLRKSVVRNTRTSSFARGRGNSGA